MSRRGLTPRPLIRTALLTAAGLLALSACGGQEAGPRLELSAALPDARLGRERELLSRHCH